MEFEEVKAPVRMSLAQMEALARSTGDVDGIPMAESARTMMHRHGLFSVKSDRESFSCQSLADDDHHGGCVQSITSSSDQARKSAIFAYLGVAKTLTAEAFEDYDEMRLRSHP